MNRADPVRIVPLEAWHAPHLEALQVTCFPTLAAGERMRAEHFRRHLEVFPAGTFVALTGAAPDGAPLPEPRVVGLGSGFLTSFDLDDPGHTFIEIIDGGWYGHHDPLGDWYYGADVSVHPDYRRRGIGGRLYDARKALCRRLDLRGIVAGGALPGFAHHARAMSAEAYVASVVAGELRDPTLSMQLRHGFEVLGVLEDYLDDPAAGGWASLIVWRNPAWSGGTGRDGA